ncbi:MAG: Tetratricopeptide 2 repeat protein [Bryobacterales bacterium]|nr:Tetratricopeptide 2 repeat protein [Bryobacterales bacterium]
MSRGFLRRFAHFLSIWLLTAAITWPQTRPPQRQPQPPPDPYNQLDSNPTLFYVLAAINAAGYDEQADSSTNSPLRGRVRDYLAKQNLASLAPLKRFVRDHKPKNPAAELGQYISFALWSKGAPDFTPANPDLPQPADADALYEFPPLLAAFYREANLAELWRQAQPDYDRAIAQFTEPLTFAVQQVNAYLRHVNTGVRRGRFQVLIDLMGAPNQVQMRNYVYDYIIVVTPAVEQPVGDIRHAYLRYLVDPLAARYAEELQKKARLGEYALQSPILDQPYRDDFVRLATESFIKAVESRLDRRSALAEQAAREGFVLAPAFAELLQQYERQEVAMQLYFPDLVSGIDVKREQQRLARIDFLKERPVRSYRVTSVVKPPELTGVAKTLDDADQLFLDREKGTANTVKAKELFLKALQETEQKPMHARAYYGLARIALLERDPETADRFFRKILELEPDPATKAWALVYIGKLSDSQGEKEPAQENYKAALAVQGISDLARQEAQRGLTGAFARNPKSKEQE